jgi:hypothetical protein
MPSKEFQQKHMSTRSFDASRVPAARKKSGLSFAQMDLQPVAVELDFMDPGVSGGRPIAQGRQCRRDELRKGTGLPCEWQQP